MARSMLVPLAVLMAEVPELQTCLLAEDGIVTDEMARVHFRRDGCASSVTMYQTDREGRRVTHSVKLYYEDERHARP